MAEQGNSVAVEAPQESTLLDSAIPAEQNEHLPDVQEPEQVHPVPEHSLAHINPFWHSNSSEQIRFSEQQTTSEPTNPLEQTIKLKENQLSEPLAAFEQPTFPEIAKSLEHAPSDAQAKSDEPLASVGNAGLSESTDVSAQNGELAQLIGINEPSSSDSAVPSQSNNEPATAISTKQTTSLEHVDTTKEHFSAEIPASTYMLTTGLDGPSEHSHPSQVPTTSSAVYHGDQMDTSEQSHHPAQAGTSQQHDTEDEQVPVGRTLDVDVESLVLRLIHMANQFIVFGYGFCAW